MSKFKVGDVVEWNDGVVGKVVVAKPDTSGYILIDCEDDYILATEKELTIKPKTIKVNGFDVPEPLREAPENAADVFLPDPCNIDCYRHMRWYYFDYEKKILQRGLCHLTKEAAIAHAKAMLGINPDDDL